MYLALSGVHDGEIGPEMCYQEYEATDETIKKIWTAGLQTDPNGGDPCPFFYTENGHRVLYTCRGKRLIFSVRDSFISIICSFSY
jgi:hypothetical protein